MIDVFTAIAKAERSASRAAYRDYLVERDGQPDIERWTLSRREATMPRFQRPLTRVRELDRVQFQTEYARVRPDRALTREALLLMALVKLNAAEAYGVSRSYGLAAKCARVGPDDVELRIHMEEGYHTRILLSSALLYGVQVQEAAHPPVVLRSLIEGMVRAPDLLSRPLILAGEIVGAVTFLNVLDAAREILKHDPELRDAIEERLIEVLTDEIGHISFNRMVAGPASLQLARVLLPSVTACIAQAVPVLGALGLTTSAADITNITTSARLPEAVRRAAFVA